MKFNKQITNSFTSYVIGCEIKYSVFCSIIIRVGSACLCSLILYTTLPFFTRVHTFISRNPF